MKFRISFLFGIMASVLCLCDAMAGTEPCPAGCFCLDNGMYQSGGHVNPSSYGGKNFCGQGTPEIQKSSNKYDYETIVMAATGTNSSNYIDINLDKAYMLKIPSGNGEAYINYYGIKDGVFYGDKITGNMFVCPMSHSYSDPKSKSLSDCFTYDEKGNKVYYSSGNYGNCDIEGVKALVENLQSALNKANKAAQELQDALKKSNSTSSNISAKAVINSGISEKVKDLKTKQTDSKNIRSSSTRSLNTDIDTAKALIKAGI